jgi:hypothetical protein
MERRKEGAPGQKETACMVSSQAQGAMKYAEEKEERYSSR